MNGFLFGSTSKAHDVTYMVQLMCVYQYSSKVMMIILLLQSSVSLIFYINFLISLIFFFSIRGFLVQDFQCKSVCSYFHIFIVVSCCCVTIKILNYIFPHKMIFLGIPFNHTLALSAFPSCMAPWEAPGSKLITSILKAILEAFNHGH